MNEAIQQYAPYVIPTCFVILVWTKFDRVYKHMDSNFVNQKAYDERTEPMQKDISEIKQDVKKLIRHNGCEND